VLIPRPETELVVETALDIAREHFRPERAFEIADVGTGSGCIAVALAKELKNAGIYALDKSQAALETACANATRNGVQSRITFLQSDLLQIVAGEPLTPLDMVVSNPPYVGERDREHVQPEVRDFEPRDAVFSGESGGEVYARLIPQAATGLRDGGFLVAELGYDSESFVRDLLSNPPWHEVRWLTDLAGIVRVASARKITSEVGMSGAAGPFHR
jgi:release factor glutamine methyltransferase